MKLVHNIQMSIFVKKNDLKEDIIDSLVVFLPENCEKEDFFSLEKVSIDDESFMEIIRFKCEKERHCKFFLNVLKNLLGKDQCELLCSQDDRVDEQGRGYLRLLKTPFFESQKLELTDCGDCIHIKLLLASYPCNKENAWKVFTNIFNWE